MRKHLRRYLPLLVLVALALLAFGLRVYHLDYFSLYQDEALTPLRASYDIGKILRNEIVIQEAVTQDTHPPFYFLIIHFTRLLFGNSDFAYRYPSVLAGVLLIPLLYQFGRQVAARRPASGRRVGFLAALLAAVNPLQVWYGQEARMYTLLLVLVTGASYALWRALTARDLSSRDLAKWFLIYIFLSALAFLTHYTTVFLIAAQALFWFWLLWQRGQKRLIIGGAIVAVLVAAPFVPYTVPRLFTGAEANYTYVSPLIMLQDVIHGFGMGLTVDFSRPLIRALDVGVFLLLLAGVVGGMRREKDGRQSPPGGAWRRRMFLLSFLLAVVVGLALGSLIKPMYQGARHIIVGSPAFFLLLACGVEALPGPSWRTVAVFVLLGGPLISLNNLYTDPLYAKDDLRGLIERVELRAGANDIVVYNDAILLSFHWHYQQRSDLAATALPVYPHAAGQQTEDRLAQMAQEYDRIWFVLGPPADKRDERRVVAHWLSQNLLLLERFQAHSLTMRTAVEAYDAHAAGLERLPQEATALDAPWAGAPTLRGWRKAFAEPAALPTLWVDLMWEGAAWSYEDLHVRLSLRDEEGRTWVDANQPLLPPTAAPANDAPLARLPFGLTLPAGIPPGEYDLLLLPWRQNTGEALGEWRRLGSVSLAPLNRWSLKPPLRMDTSTVALFGNDMRLLGISGTVLGVRPGNALPLTLFWQADGLPEQANVRYEMEMVSPAGDVWFTRSGAPGPDWLSPGAWPMGVPLRELIGINVPADAPPGVYTLRWRLLAGGEVVGGRPSWRPWFGEWVSVGRVQVMAWPLETELPVEATPVGASFGEAIELASYRLEGTRLQAGEPLQLTLYWRAREKPQENYLVFVHVATPDGTIVAQADRIPVDWKRPTQGWRAGEVLTDAYEIWLPDDAPQGPYEIYVGFFNPESEQRPPVTYEGQLQADGRLLLTTVMVQAR